MTEPFATALVLTAVGLLLLIAVLSSPLAQRLGVPTLLIFLVIGMLAGSEGVGGIPYEDYDGAFSIGTVALALILFDGALNTPLTTFRRALLPAGLLATVGVILTAAVVAACGVIIGLPLPIAALVGCVVSSTDAAAVFAVLRGGGTRLRGATGATLEVESGLNDPMAVLLTLAGTAIVLHEDTIGLNTLLFFAEQIVIGALGGVAVGYAARLLLQRVRLPAAGLYVVLTMAIAFVAYGLPTLLEGSGFLAVYLAGLVLGDAALPYRPGIRRVHDALAWLFQVVMFLVLGLLAFPSRLEAVWDDGIVVGLALAFVARPIAVWVTLLPIRLSWRAKLFISWVGLRGAVPIILATYPVLSGVPDGKLIFDVVFFVVLVNSFVPGATVGWLARRLGLAEADPFDPPASVDLISEREFPGEFIWYRVASVCAVAGAPVSDIPLPTTCVLTLVLRARQVISVRGDTVLEPRDQVCLFARYEDRPLLDLLFGRPLDDT